MARSAVDTGIPSLNRDIDSYLAFAHNAEQLEKSIRNASSAQDLVNIVGDGAMRVILAFDNDEAFARLLGNVDASANDFLKEIQNEVREKLSYIAKHPNVEGVNTLFGTRARTEADAVDHNVAYRKLNFPGSVATFPFLHPRGKNKLFPAARIFIFNRQRATIADFTANWIDTVTLASGLLESIVEQRKTFADLVSKPSETFSEEELEGFEDAIQDIEEAVKQIRDWLNSSDQTKAK